MQRQEFFEISEESDIPSLTATLSAASSSSISPEINVYRNPSNTYSSWAPEPFVIEDSVFSIAPGFSPSSNIFFNQATIPDLPFDNHFLNFDAYPFDLCSRSDKVPWPVDGIIELPLATQESNENPGYASTYWPAVFSDQTELNATEDLHTSRRKGNMLVSIPEASAAEVESEQQYIVGLASEMQRRLRHLSDAGVSRSWNSSFPSVIRAFTIRLGYESSNDISHNTWQIIHKNSGKETDGTKGNLHDMSVEDKMSLWEDQKNPNCTPSPQYTQLKEDTRDRIESSTRQIEYEAILESRAFHWLLKHLERQASLWWDDNDLGICVQEEIQRKVMDLFALRIDERHTSEIQKIKFQLLDWPLLGIGSDKQHHQHNDKTKPLRQVTLESAVVTWPSSWKQAFDLLQSCADFGETRALDNRHQIVGPPGHPNLLASVEDGRLTVTVEGYPYFIAEYGEQLAWLSAAVAQNSRAAYRRPTITRQREIGSDETIFCFDIVLEEEPLQSLPPQERSLAGILGQDFVAIRGFPILRRPKEFPGMEIPWNMRKAIALAKQTQNISLWSEVATGKNARLMIGYDATQVMELVRYQTGRHIITQIGDSTWPETPSGFSSSGGKSKGPAVDVNSSTPSVQIMETIELSPCHSNTYGNQSKFEHCKSGLIDLHNGGGDGAADSAAAESADSLDTDLLSVSDESDDIDFQPLYEDHPILPLIQAIARTLLRDYRLQTQHRGETSSSGASSSASALDQTQEEKGPSNPQLPVNRKRKPETELKSGREPAKSSGSAQEAKKQQLTLACPFWKFNTDKYHVCVTKKLTRVRDVKQHLKRSHTPEHYCQRCFKIFANEDSLRGHVSNPEGWTCLLNETGALDGISHEQSRNLHRKSAPRQTDENQWFAIWDILFPGKTKPRSAYMNPNMCEELSAFHEHLNYNAAQIVQDSLETAGFLWHLTTEEDSQNLRRVVNEAIYAMQQEWISNRTTMRPIASARHSHHQSHPGNSQPVRGLTTPTDSGIGLESQTDGSYRRPSTVPQQANLSGSEQQDSSTGIESQVLTRLEDAARNMPVFDGGPTTNSLAAQPASNFWVPQAHLAGLTGLFGPDSRMNGFGAANSTVPPIDLSFWGFDENVGHVAPALTGAATAEIPSSTAQTP
ncbi:hypothetical protein CMEL01_04420 [Colletotrichum melonis]|uniref:C2H2-type domain-containing protein n=1 Tax=Colletotrichum melonis TaxID=1209925 RepID=A0AAI9UC67_9PEZI|nr:hypothetical protein CMEL01_04420 [Colletotrichum melonis]